MRTNLVIVENGKFIFDTNFAGDTIKMELMDILKGDYVNREAFE